MNMNNLMNRAPFAIGVVTLGARCLFFKDFALQWQSAPHWLKGVPGAAIVSALWLLATGVAILVEKMAWMGAISAAVLFGVWALVCHGPLVAAQPAQVYLWLGVCEAGCLMAAGLALVGADIRHDVTAARLAMAARIIFGLCALIFGISHFAYADITAKMVPAWMPLPMGWAYQTGAGHLLAGLALVSGVGARLAGGLEAAMCACFVVFLHIPRTIAAPTSQMEWTMTSIALSITGAAWVIRNQTCVPVAGFVRDPAATGA